MSVHISGKYNGNKKMSLTHVPSGTVIATAAPLDNLGDGSSFSPTDLVAAALGSCVVTTMAIFAERSGIALKDANFRIEKIMSTETPRRIARLPLTVHLPASLTEEERTKLERVGHTCPVHKSLGTEIDAPIAFLYDL
jgi:putative redox protein